MKPHSTFGSEVRKRKGRKQAKTQVFGAYAARSAGGNMLLRRRRVCSFILSSSRRAHTNSAASKPSATKMVTPPGAGVKNITIPAARSVKPKRIRKNRLACWKVLMNTVPGSALPPPRAACVFRAALCLPWMQSGPDTLLTIYSARSLPIRVALAPRESPADNGLLASPKFPKRCPVPNVGIFF